MKQIFLSQGKFAIVDDEDYEFLNQWNWTAIKHRNTFYALRKIRIKGQSVRKNIHMHRLVLRAPDDMQVDHINGNALDNRKKNLRLVTPQQNSMNRAVTSNNSSGCTGVHFHRHLKKWIAKIRKNKKAVHLGVFEKREDAISARREAEKQYFGEFARRQPENI